MARMTGSDCAVMCNLINTHTHTLYLAPNQSSRAPSTHTVGRSSCKIYKTQESASTKRAMVRFRGAREKGAMAFVEYVGFSQ